MRVPASPLLVFGFASAATVSWGAPASPALGNVRVPHSPAMPASAQNSPAPSYAATFGSPAPDHSATFSPSPTVGSGGDSYTGQAGQTQGGDMQNQDMSDHIDGMTAEAKSLDVTSDGTDNGGKVLAGEMVGGYGSSQRANTYRGSGENTNGGSLLGARYAADGDLGVARAVLDLPHYTIPGDQEALNLVSSSEGHGGRALSGGILGGSAAGTYDVRPGRQIDLGINRIGSGAL
ncbi:MAG: hypothetical protein TREMPRED_000433 [Tremellales sp. Tagirdzhanova-0007]|nr:MAG: hypothetical protein TREMPRED_000433 [Tremellales sp. Tagirdzhanova-0007]